MNEFTKGELGIILLEMNISIQRTPKQLKVSPVFLELRDKVEKMIDNYCEHTHVYDPGMPTNCPRCATEVAE